MHRDEASLPSKTHKNKGKRAHASVPRSPLSFTQIASFCFTKSSKTKKFINFSYFYI
ncbi:hypothetical protein HMPREF0083_02431 [Aneurinibacillus aneurinilyticus ATCC 12856]|uniref:Uncharacterized protein n=1 Tax=Aneurinibacillus aneurinilyticus ATCC 12856 TaxID=649747 RepID=U1YBL5_ANEAE|nr:hypothetical protein HMPREF0083_02431 [Aneurinibacillus aneurinilyticus ATCC 12856]